MGKQSCGHIWWPYLGARLGDRLREVQGLHCHPPSNSVPIEGLSLGEPVPSSGSQGNLPCIWEEVGACL